jgi:L,D-transpeptidase catalytic domain
MLGLLGPKLPGGLRSMFCVSAATLSAPAALRHAAALLRVFAFVAALAAALLAVTPRAEAGVVITVDKSTQQLSVAVDGVPRYEWPVSTARWGYTTPNGTYTPQRLERQWYSRKYDWSPMPYSIFFDGGYAIHGSYEISSIGRPASHGCVRLHPANAAVLFALVQRNRGDTSIVVTGERPSREEVERAVHRVREEEAERPPHRRHVEEEYYSRRVRERLHRRVHYSRRHYRRRDIEEVFTDGPDEGDVEYAIRRGWYR